MAHTELSENIRPMPPVKTSAVAWTLLAAPRDRHVNENAGAYAGRRQRAGNSDDDSHLHGGTNDWSVGDSMATLDSAMDLLISTEMATLAEQMRAAAGIW
jgi:hypothetical protein